MSFRVQLSGMKVAIGMPLYGRIPARTALMLAMTGHLCGKMGIQFEPIIEVGGIVDVTRDGVIDAFLKSDNEKLFWIDSDIVWSTDHFSKFLALSTKVDIVGATYPYKKDLPQTVYCVNVDEGVSNNELGLLPVKGMGLGFTLMNRNVIEAVVKGKPRFKNRLNNREMAKVFRVDILDGDLRTEDMAFFHDLADLGFQVWLDPTIDLGHIGEKEWQGNFSSTLVRKDNET